MLTRRNALKATAAIALTQAAPTAAASPAEAAEAAPVPQRTPNTRTVLSMDEADVLCLEAVTHTSPFWHPKLDSFGDIGEDLMAHQWAAYQQALDALIDRYPDVDPKGHSLLGSLEETVSHLFFDSWWKALHIGYALAAGDAPVIGYTRERRCDECDGSGRFWNREDGARCRPQATPAEAATTCTTCAGKGIVDEAALATYHPLRTEALPAWMPRPTGVPFDQWQEAYVTASIQAYRARRERGVAERHTD